jgi:hypothetical protein
MLIEKIRRGILQVTTDSGLHYVQPSLFEKLQLLWTFRNFRVLPSEVLTQHERQFIGQLCSQSRLQKPSGSDFAEKNCVIGTVDLTPEPLNKLLKNRAESAQHCSA